MIELQDTAREIFRAETGAPTSLYFRNLFCKPFFEKGIKI